MDNDFFSFFLPSEIEETFKMSKNLSNISINISMPSTFALSTGHAHTSIVFETTVMQWGIKKNNRNEEVRISDRKNKGLKVNEGSQ